MFINQCKLGRSLLASNISRLSHVISNTISTEQCAFIEDCNILDTVLIVAQTVQNIKQ